MIRKITENKKHFLELLLLADEQESMIDKYLERGEMYVLYHNNIAVSSCVVTDESNATLEIKNMATSIEFQGKGFGKQLIQFIVDEYKDAFDLLIVGTGDSPLTLPFYKKCGFIETHRIKNFFIENYDHPIYEADKQLVDMIYLEMAI